MDGCWFKPDIDIFDYEYVYESPANLSDLVGSYDLPCKLCWPRGARPGQSTVEVERINALALAAASSSTGPAVESDSDDESSSTSVHGEGSSENNE